jgi:DNA-binding MarR family transcriptional regulator
MTTASILRRGVTGLAWRLRRLRADQAVSPAKLALLGRLYRADRPLTAIDLARLEGLQPQSLSRLIAELDQTGLIERRLDDLDRRQILITITDRGRTLLVTDAARQDLWLNEAMARQLTATECEILRLAAGLLLLLAEEPDPSTD